MNPQDGSSERPEDQNQDLFDDIRQYLAEQSGEDVYEELSRAYKLASTFAERELRGRPEYQRMLRGIERLVDDVFARRLPATLRSEVAEVLYLYGLAHYSILQQIIEDVGDEELESESRAASPLIVYDLWFPSHVGIEQNDDGYFLHIGDGRIDVSIYLGTTPNERGLLVDLIDHWEYAAANTEPSDDIPPVTEGLPVMAVEMDYQGSELIDAGDHVDILLFDHRGDPFIRIHARHTDLRVIVDELQAVESDQED